MGVSITVRGPTRIPAGELREAELTWRRGIYIEDAHESEHREVNAMADLLGKQLRANIKEYKARRKEMLTSEATTDEQYEFLILNQSDFAGWGTGRPARIKWKPSSTN